ncbi:MAG: hypothetical protein WAW11_05070 [Patescibacteria group bacterium]
MKKSYKKMLYVACSMIAIVFGIFIFIYGGYDDSPGAQLLGLIIFILGVRGVIKNMKKESL